MKQSLGSFWQDPLLIEAIALWRNYCLVCERFDRTVCTGPIVNGSIMPETNQELAAINRHAIWQLAKLKAEAAQVGISNATLSSAKRIVLKGMDK